MKSTKGSKEAKESNTDPFSEKSNTALWTCDATDPAKYSDYEIVFCPNGTDYVGPKLEQVNTKYFSATATCSNMATTFSQNYTVGPSPTLIATKGTLPVVATALAGLDGAAAYEVVPSGSGPSSSALPGNLAAVPSSSTSSAAAGAPGQGDGHWSYYWETGPTAGAASSSNQVAFSVSTTTSATASAAAAVKTSKNHCKGGQYLKIMD